VLVGGIKLVEQLLQATRAALLAVTALVVVGVAAKCLSQPVAPRDTVVQFRGQILTWL
jgi:hypothetical protein